MKTDNFAFGALVLLIVSVFWFSYANATGYGNTTTTNNFYPQTIIDGVSDSDLAKGIATAAAVNHPWDYSVKKDWQAGINGAFYDDENAVSFGVAKRFDKMDALWHGSFTQNGSESLYTVGAVFRF